MTQLSYTIDQAANVTGLGKTKLYEEINRGRLRAVKAGKRTLIPHAAIQDWLQSLDAYPASQASTAPAGQ
ncbi:MAG TPA: helix-turn-helix domain-containing protein [Alphaproteobacteria bacterium]|nr:helix-turn-helix domain-containing protein [Alphaproteobacteria bacterium]